MSHRLHIELTTGGKLRGEEIVSEEGVSADAGTENGGKKPPAALAGRDAVAFLPQLAGEQDGKKKKPPKNNRGDCKQQSTPKNVKKF